MKLFLAILFLGFFSIANCQETETSITKKEDFQDWQLRVGPYLWFLGIEGTLENPPVSIQPPGEHYDFDKSISDLNNSLKFALSLNIEYYRKKWMGIINYFSFDLHGEDKTSDEHVPINVFYRWAPTFGDVKVGYRAISKNKLKLDGFIGAQINFAKMIYTFNAGTSDIYIPMIEVIFQ